MELCRTVDQMFEALMMLLPPGKAWQRDLGIKRQNSVLKQFMWALASSLANFEDACCRTFDEFFAATAQNDVDLWEEEYGVDFTDGIDLITKVSAIGGTKLSYYHDIATNLGWSTVMRWLKNDTDHPGVWSTLLVTVNVAESPAAAELDVTNWLLPISEIGPKTLTNELTDVLNFALPAHTTIIFENV